MGTGSLCILLATAICLTTSEQICKSVETCKTEQICDNVTVITVTTVKPFSNNRFRTVEILRDEPVMLECPDDKQPFMELGTAQLMEAYSYNKEKQTCRIPAAFCQPSSNLLPPPTPSAAIDDSGMIRESQRTTDPKLQSLVRSCSNSKNCTLLFNREDYLLISQCGLNTPMRLVLTFRCSSKKV
ncbi:uncharacterized protein LOC129590699 [Paramacrobiotus metropolitanus]|uniref:uncharacterized protein LOC129590699 n=1 Tax=Paramacrobiotus metropolitanus TaxID=2943436 RepID=UPI002445AE6B|nr:uncharacterized protein LOC129590699 [Paramacrobiotus metropolitanus]